MTHDTIDHQYRSELSPVPPLRPVHHCADYMIYLIDDFGCSKCDEHELSSNSSWE